MVVSQPLAQVPGGKKLGARSCTSQQLRTERAGTEQSQARRLLLLGPGMSYQNHSLRQESFTKSLDYILWGNPSLLLQETALEIFMSLSLSFIAPGIFESLSNYKKWRTSIFEIPFHLMSSYEGESHIGGPSIFIPILGFYLL